MIDPREERNWAMACHLAALIGFIGMPFGTILGPLVVWLIKRSESVLVEQNGKEALNFQISMAIYAVVAGVLIFIAIGYVLLAGLVIADVVLLAMAAVKINNGENYQYPFTIRFIK